MKNLAILFFSSLTGLTCQCAFAESHSEPTQDLSQFTLTLNNTGKQCTLVAGKQENPKQTITLLLESPCHWVTSSESSDILQYSYPEKKADTILLAAGTSLDWPDEKKTYHKLPPEKACSRYLQGIIISNDKVFAVDDKMDAPHCKGLTVDEKVFHQAAYTDNRYQETPANSVETDAAQATPEPSGLEKKQDEPDQINTEENDTFFGSIQKTLQRVFSPKE